ncbi:MAG: hypothetical protein JWN44_5003 [Myxococcales bacterium]|nr:hypothetical protein [Myxococcales bacterium]
MDAALHERLLNARARLSAALEHSRVPEWLAQTAQRCLIDLDGLSSGGLSAGKARMLLAQIDALITVADESGLPTRGRADADS